MIIRAVFTTLFCLGILAGPAVSQEYLLKWALDNGSGPDFESQSPYRGTFKSVQECEAFVAAQPNMTVTSDGKTIYHKCYLATPDYNEMVTKYELRYAVAKPGGAPDWNNPIYSQRDAFDTQQACFRSMADKSEFNQIQKKFAGRRIVSDCNPITVYKYIDPATIEGDECDGC